MKSNKTPLKFRLGWLQQINLLITSYSKKRNIKFLWFLNSLEFYIEWLFQTHYKNRSNNHKLLINILIQLKKNQKILNLIYIRNKIRFIKQIKKNIIKRFEYKIKKFILLKKKFNIIINNINYQKKIILKNNKSLLIIRNHFPFLLFITYKVKYWYNAQGLTKFKKSHLDRYLSLRFLLSFILSSIFYNKLQKFKQRQLIFLTSFGYFNGFLIGLSLRCSGRFNKSRSQMSNLLWKHYGKLNLHSIIIFTDFYQTKIITKKGILSLNVWLSYTYYIT